MAVASRLAGHHPSVATIAVSSKFVVSRSTNWLVFDVPAKLPRGRGRGRGRGARVVDGRSSKSRRWTPGPVAALGGLLGGIFGDGTDTGESTQQLYVSTVALINKMESEISSLSDSQLRETKSALQQRAARGDSLDSILPEAFAVVREASKRVLGLRPFEVQLIGGDHFSSNNNILFGEFQ